MEAVLDLLMTIEAGNGNPAKVRFEEWVRQTKKDSDILPILLENRWNAGNGFTDWLEDATIFTDDKGELLQRMVVEKVHEWVGLLRRQPEESKAVIFVAYLLILWDFRGVSPCHRLNLCTLKVSTLNVPPLL